MPQNLMRFFLFGSLPVPASPAGGRLAGKIPRSSAVGSFNSSRLGRTFVAVELLFLTINIAEIRVHAM